MKPIYTIFLCLLPLLSQSQSNLRVYTVVGIPNPTSSTPLGDNGPATAAYLGATEGVWLDNSHNIYISDLMHDRIRKVAAATGVITTIAGNGTGGFSGDNGLATNASISSPYGLYADVIGNVYFADKSNNRIRRIDAASGIITTIAGGGGTLGDNGQATDAKLDIPQNVYLDALENIYIGERGRIRKVTALTGIITTIAGNGTIGFSGDGGPATNAQLSTGPTGMAIDASGNLLFADRVNHRVRKINTVTGIITTIAGSNTFGYSGDGGLATNAQLRGPISIVLDKYGNLIIGDNVNNYIRKVDANTGVISTIAGVGPFTTGIFADGAPATSTEIHPEFLCIDTAGNIYYSNWGNLVRKIVNYYSWLSAKVKEINQTVGAVNLYPNPVNDELQIELSGDFTSYAIFNGQGSQITRHSVIGRHFKINIKELPPGAYIIAFYGYATMSSRFTKN